MRYIFKIKKYLHFKLFQERKYIHMMKNIPVEKGKILFFTFQGTYTCNLKYISKEIFNRTLPWKQVWVVFDSVGSLQGQFPEEVELVQFGTKEYYEALGSSQIWIDNAFNYPKGAVFKKKEQVYVQTMHGSLGIKKIGPDAVRRIRRNHRGRRCGRLTDICISNSSFENMVYETSFWRDSDIQMLGHARNDILFDSGLQDGVVSKVKKCFSLHEDVHLALYAPTFKNRDENSTCEELDYRLLRDTLEKRFGGTWIILSRPHHSSYSNNKDIYCDYVKDASGYPDIQELMIATDVGITDYSSWIFDYVLTKKPGFLYTPDLDHYHLNRGFYYPIEEAPFPVCHSNVELAKQIECYNENLFQGRVDEFLQARGSIDDGCAASRIVDMLCEIVENRN